MAALILAIWLAAAPHKASRAIITFYWIVDESSARYRGEPGAILNDERGGVIAHTTRRFKRELIREGTGWLRDGRTIMYVRKVHGEDQFRITKTRYGYASTGCPLNPYRTVAVDARFVPMGSTIFIPQLKGSRLPDGTIHDGMFLAVDRGHIRGHHVDIFVGAGARAARPFIRKGYGSRSHVTIELMERSPEDCGR